ncbi:hypothetical protein RBB79_19350 [Tunturiibacter empetritectus]|uniref:Uncharacterized protein n=1 Tax=Tunturiibacter lichenicola TaxID=2051959 RepID=A0A852VQI3_9BACT|nr:hypothetical protein [Edaphobacter lichenicola]NYF91826.1 hypothetical protein [Edaphobacter lichenicola]
MQNARDTFYVTLRDRLAAVNPARTIVLRGVIRPGVLVEENELASATVPVNAFCLHWTALGVDAQGALPLVTMACEISYATDGDSGNGGMDRGRLLSAMDAELVAAVSAAPQSVTKRNYVGAAAGSGLAPVAMGTNVFWGDAAFGAAVVNGERLERVAAVEVFCYQEAGEL